MACPQIPTRAWQSDRSSRTRPRTVPVLPVGIRPATLWQPVRGRLAGGWLLERIGPWYAAVHSGAELASGWLSARTSDEPIGPGRPVTGQAMPLTLEQVTPVVAPMPVDSVRGPSGKPAESCPIFRLPTRGVPMGGTKLGLRCGSLGSQRRMAPEELWFPLLSAGRGQPRWLSCSSVLPPSFLWQSWREEFHSLLQPSARALTMLSPAHCFSSIPSPRNKVCPDT